jgi:hypothetical protein
VAGAGYSDRRDLYRRDKCALQKTPSDERMTSGDRRTRLCGRRLSTMSIVHDQRFHDQRWRRDRERLCRSRALPAEKVDKTGGQT